MGTGGNCYGKIRFLRSEIHGLTWKPGCPVVCTLYSSSMILSEMQFGMKYYFIVIWGEILFANLNCCCCCCWSWLYWYDWHLVCWSLWILSRHWSCLYTLVFVRICGVVESSLLDGLIVDLVVMYWCAYLELCYWIHGLFVWWSGEVDIPFVLLPWLHTFIYVNVVVAYMVYFSWWRIECFLLHLKVWFIVCQFISWYSISWVYTEMGNQNWDWAISEFICTFGLEVWDWG